MDMGADIRKATHSAVPSGLMQFQISIPNVETLGYYRPSLRDDEWQILVALDKNVRAPEKSDAHLRILRVLSVLCLVGRVHCAPGPGRPPGGRCPPPGPNPPPP